MADYFSGLPIEITHMIIEFSIVNRPVVRLVCTAWNAIALLVGKVATSDSAKEPADVLKETARYPSPNTNLYPFIPSMTQYSRLLIPPTKVSIEVARYEIGLMPWVWAEMRHVRRKRVHVNPPGVRLRAGMDSAQHSILQKWFYVAANRGNLLAMAWCKKRGAVSFNGALVNAAYNNQLAAMRLCRGWGATKYDAAMTTASLRGHFGAINLCHSWMEEEAARIDQLSWSVEQQADVFMCRTLCKRAYAIAASNAVSLLVAERRFGADEEYKTIAATCKIWENEAKAKANAAFGRETQDAIRTRRRSKSKNTRPQHVDAQVDL
jgi:hypothetical protein